MTALSICLTFLRVSMAVTNKEIATMTVATPDKSSLRTLAIISLRSWLPRRYHGVVIGSENQELATLVRSLQRREDGAEVDVISDRPSYLSHTLQDSLITEATDREPLSLVVKLGGDVSRSLGPRDHCDTPSPSENPARRQMIFHSKMVRHDASFVDVQNPGPGRAPLSSRGPCSAERVVERSTRGSSESSRVYAIPPIGVQVRQLRAEEVELRRESVDALSPVLLQDRVVAFDVERQDVSEPRKESADDQMRLPISGRSDYGEMLTRGP